MSIRNTRGLEWIARAPLFVQDFYRALRVAVFPIARPVESAAESVALVAVAAVNAVLAIIVRGVYDLASHVVERLPQHRHMRIIQ
jgi:hypothetical protein